MSNTYHTADLRLPRWSDLPDIELYMDQVITLMNKYIGVIFEDGEAQLTSSMINNYVKHGILPRPNKKRYSKPHIARLMIICTLKPVLSIPYIGTLINAMLEKGSEAEMLDLFADICESAFAEMKGMLDGSGGEDTLRLVLRAAAMSDCGKMIAEKEISETMTPIESDNDKKEGDIGK